MKKLIRQYARQYTSDDMAPLRDWVVAQGKQIQQIPAPTFDEAERAAYVASQFETLGLLDVHTDELYNVYGKITGEEQTGQGLMIMAHTDTVFPAEADLVLKDEESTIHGAGLGDNSIGVAGMLGLAHALQQEPKRPAVDLWFVATTREEGLGNLDGARQAYATLRDKIGMVINVEGLAYGYVYHAGIAVRRLHITASAPGGHSWLHFGRPSAVHTIVKLGAAIADITVPEAPRTTYNIGIIEGGHSINSIATDAGLWLDMRSEDPDALNTLEGIVRDLIQQYKTPDVPFEVTVVGDRPAGSIQTSHPLIEGAMAALEQTGTRGILQIGSTDGNIPLADGCPAVTIGITRGGNAHRLDEYIETEPIAKGLRQLIILTLAAAAHQSAFQTTVS